MLVRVAYPNGSECTQSPVAAVTLLRFGCQQERHPPPPRISLASSLLLLPGLSRWNDLGTSSTHSPASLPLIPGLSRWNDTLLVDLRLAGLVEAWAAGATWGASARNAASLSSGS